MYFLGLDAGKFKTSLVFTGYVTALLEGSVLPPGWGVTRDNNVYEVTHGLNLTNLTDLIGSITIFNPPTTKTVVFPREATNNSMIIEVWEGSKKKQSDFAFTAIKV